MIKINDSEHLMWHVYQSLVRKGLNVYLQQNLIVFIKIEFFNLFTVHTLFNNSCIKLVLIYFQVIACLKQQYRKNKRLSRLCENEIVRIMREAAQDYNLDPQLTQACSGEVCVSFII